MEVCFRCKTSAERETQPAEYWVKRRSFSDAGPNLQRKKYYCEYHLAQTDFRDNHLWKVRLIEPEQTDLLQGVFANE